MLKRLFILMSILISSSLVVYQPLLSYIAEKSSYRHAEQLIAEHKNEIVRNIQHSEKIIDGLSKETIKCDQEKLWLIEYQHPVIRLFGWRDMKTNQFCWSEGFITNSKIRHVTLVNKIQLSKDKVVALANISGTYAIVFYKYIGNIRWFSSFEQIRIRDKVCNGCYTVTWMDPKKDNTSSNEQNEYQVQSNLHTIPILFSFDLQSMQKNYRDILQYWLLLALILINLITIFIYIRSHLNQFRPEIILKRAIDKNNIQPFYQPIIDTKNGKVCSAEVLARWKIKDEYLPPSKFIMLAESSGLIDPLLTSLVKQTQKYIDENPTLLNNIEFSYNIAPTQIERILFIQGFLKLCKKNHRKNHPIGLEITERQAFQDLTRAKEILNEFSALGIKIKLDDTGTGYGSFSYIQNLGFDTIKIDKMFVDTIETDNIKRSVLDAIIEFGHTANLQMIAEGVENEKQANYLIEHGVTIHQGFYYSKPLHKEDFVNFLKKYA